MKVKFFRVGLVLVLSSLIFANPAFSDTRVDTHTMLLLTMDEGSGDVVKDSSGKGIDGKVVGAKWVQGKNGTALEFNGTATSNVVMTASTLFDFVKTFSLEAWVKFPTKQSDAKIICKHESGGYALELRDDKVGAQPHINGAYQAVTGKTALEVNKWYYFSMTYDGSKIKVYVNGELDGEKDIPAPGNVTKSTPPLMLGGNPNPQGVSTGQFFSGDIDEVRVSDIARTQAEIKAAMDFKEAAVNHNSKLTTTWSEIKIQP